MTADVQELPGSDGLRAWTIVLEVVLGAWLLFLFLLALAWDPIDRKIGTRGRELAGRASRRVTDGGQGATATGSYAILPVE